MNQRQKGLAQLLIPCGHTPTWLEILAEPFPLLTEFVEVLLLVKMGCPVALREYDRHNGMRDEVLAHAVPVIPLVPNGLRWQWP